MTTFPGAEVLLPFYSVGKNRQDWRLSVNTLEYRVLQNYEDIDQLLEFVSF